MSRKPGPHVVLRLLPKVHNVECVQSSLIIALQPLHILDLFCLQVQKYVKENGGQELDLDQWRNLFNISSCVGSDLVQSPIVKMILRYEFSEKSWEFCACPMVD